MIPLYKQLAALYWRGWAFDEKIRVGQLEALLAYYDALIPDSRSATGGA